MNAWSWVTGSVLVEIISASPEQLITAVNHVGIVIYKAKRLDDLTVRAVINKSDLPVLETLVAKRCETVRVLGRFGFVWALKRFLRRPVLAVAFSICLLLTLFLPSRVFFIKVEGNQFFSQRKILDAAEQCGVAFGTVRGNIRSEQVKNQMLQLLPELKWVGVNTRGCVATITVSERSTAEQIKKEVSIHGIFAVRDGIIRNATATKGTLLCKPGEAVRKGQLLISPYTDCGLLLRAETACGEIIADTVHELQAVTPIDYSFRTGEPAVKVKYSILVGKKLINLFKYSGIPGAGCVRIYKAYRLQLPGGFCLPVTLIRMTDSVYDTHSADITDVTGYRWMDEAMRSYLQTKMLAGTVYHSDTNGGFGDGVYTYFGEYACTEMIGRIKSKEYTDEDGKRN